MPLKKFVPFKKPVFKKPIAELVKEIHVPIALRKTKFFDRRKGTERRLVEKDRRKASFQVTKTEIFKESPKGKDIMLGLDYRDNPENAAKRSNLNPEDKLIREVDSFNRISEKPLTVPAKHPAKKGHYSVSTQVEVSTDRRSRKTDRRKQAKKK
ncbi:MAG: hypothetical protein ABH986_01850 [archaeon]